MRVVYIIYLKFNNLKLIMVNKKLIKKCSCCGKMLRDYNQSGVCSACRNAKKLIICPEIIKNVRVL